MVKKKKQTKKKKTTIKNNNAIIKELKKITLGIIILVFIVATVAMIADFYISEISEDKIAEKTKKTETKETDKKSTEKKTKKSLEKAKTESEKKKAKDEEASSKVRFEVFDDDTSSIPSKIHVKDPVIVLPVIKKNGLPLVAIIIDDIGYSRRNTRTIALLDKNITFAVLPFSPHGTEMAAELHNNEHQIMLHLPMEPVEYPSVDSGPGSLLADMTPDQLILQLRKNLDAIPYIVGVNNHMGSKLTSMSSKMNQIFSILKQRDLFFIDSITTGRTKCASAAALLNVSFGQRDIFIDNIQDSEYIMGQIKQLIEKAQKNGSAIGIAHPYGATAETLKKNMPWIKKKVQLVPASVLTAKLSG
ncbi:MAG: divergent polysaccharide deacetylase family protein [Desulfobacterales bacterium]|nr:divergent polysaccharide deacetylase family protein [Desulfobacterales bacterium]